MASPTPNKGYTYPAHGGAVNAWDAPLNNNFDQIDLNVAGYYPITVTSTATTVTFNNSYAVASSTAATITPPSSIAQNLTYVIGGTITQNVKLVLPSAGGFYNVYNNTSGSFNFTVGTSGGTAVTINQGGTNQVTCYDGTNFILTDSNPIPARLYTYAGNPNGSVAGTVGATNGALTDVIWDKTNRQFYAVTTGSSAAASTVWAPQIPQITPGGYLTLNNNTTSPIVTSNTTGTTIYYTPLVSNWTVLSTGTILFPYQFSQMSIPLTASQAASNIYDIFMWWNGGTPVIGTGPSWTAGGGSVTGGSCARGTGAGSTALTRLQGVLVNSVQVALINNVTNYTCPANEGIYLGSIFVDGSAGQVTCHRTWGQSRKWGVWNYYNRMPVALMMGDSTSSWTYSSATVRQSNGAAANTLATFSGIAEDVVAINLGQKMSASSNPANPSANLNSGIGVNSTTSYTGQVTDVYFSISNSNVGAVSYASYQLPPALGINNINSLESVPIQTVTNTFYGTSAYMNMTARWMA